MDDNPLVHMKEAAYTNDTAIIRRNPKVTAINSAIEIDLTGQVCADTIGQCNFLEWVVKWILFVELPCLKEEKRLLLCPPLPKKEFQNTPRF